MSKLKLSLDLRKQLKTIARQSSAVRGKVLFHEGDPVRGAFLIRSGSVKLSLEGAAKLYGTRTVGAGDIFGLPATVLGKPYSLTAKALKDCDLYFIPRAKLLKLLRQDPRVGYQVVRILGSEINLMRSAAQKIPRPDAGKTHSSIH